MTTSNRDGSTQVDQLLNSKDGAEMLKQMAALGYRVGSTDGINSLDAAKNTYDDNFSNATEAQLGASEWQITGRSGNTAQVMVTNQLTVNSFLYHSGGNNYMRGPIDTPYGPINFSNEPMSTIAQTLIFKVKAH